MPFRTIALEKSGPIAYLALNRPEKGNAIDGQLLRELTQACERIGDDEGVRVAILSGGEAPVFSMGWDWSLLAGEDPLMAARDQGILGNAFACLAQLSRPVVCAINGDAFSAGLELALACDVRLAASTARFGFPETTMGLLPMGGGSQRLPRLVGRGKALELIMTAEPIDAQEALRIGLVSRVVPAERLMAEAETVAQRIAQRGPIAVRYAKEAVSRGLDMTLEQGLRYETDLTVILQTTEDRAEGVRAFLEKRQPHFRGR